MNQAARRHPDAAVTLSKVAQELRVAQGTDLIELRREFRREIRELVEAAEAIAREAHHATSPAFRRNAAASVEAAATHPDLADRLRTGTLTEELWPEPSFGVSAKNARRQPSAVRPRANDRKRTKELKRVARAAQARATKLRRLAERAQAQAKRAEKEHGRAADNASEALRRWLDLGILAEKAEQAASQAEFAAENTARRRDERL